MKRIHLILAVLAIVLVLCASIGAASAYFTTYADARGGYVIHMKYESEIEEKVEGNVKQVTIKNIADEGTENGTFPVFVRARVLAGNDVDISDTQGTNWVKNGDYYFYTIVLFTGDSSETLNIKVKPAANSTVRAGDPIDVIVTYESVPAVFLPDGTPDMATSWANSSAIKTIATING